MIHYASSALPRIIACNGSVALSEAAPKEAKTDDAKEGTAFHHFAALLLTGQSAALGDAAPNGHILDAEMLDHARDYATRLKANEDWPQRVEAPMHWGPGGVATDTQPWQVRVKCDAVTWRPDISTLAVTDAKYGFRFVDPQDNWQLLSQAVGACFSLAIQPRRIILAIYQPRGTPQNPLRSVEITAHELLTAYSVLCERLTNLTRALNTGPHCKHCPAHAGCPATERAFYNAIDVAMDGGDYNADPARMAARLALVQRASELIKQYGQWIEGAALAELKAGRPVPGLSTKAVLGHTTWTKDGANELASLESPNQQFHDRKPVTPAEAKRRGMSEEDVKRLTYRPSLGVKLVTTKASEKDAARAFGEGPAS